MEIRPDDATSVLKDRRVKQRRQWIVELWSYALLMSTALTCVTVLLTGDFLLAIPVVGVCFVVGCVGTLLAVSRSKNQSDDVNQNPGVFR